MAAGATGTSADMTSGTVEEKSPDVTVSDVLAAGGREVTGEALWFVSGAKPGNSVEQLTDNNVRACVRACVTAA